MPRNRERSIADHARGRRGEDVAARYLQRRGWVVLDRNWRGPGGELDLVALRRGTLLAVEVKARPLALWDQDEIVGVDQRTRIARALIDYRGRHPGLRAPETRVDLVLVDLSRRPARVRRVEGIVSGDDPVVPPRSPAWSR